MNSVYMVRNVRGEWLRWVGRWLFSRDGDAVAFSSREKAVALAKEKGGEVVEFVPRAEVQELVEALRGAYDVAIASGPYGELERTVAAFRMLKKWEPEA